MSENNGLIVILLGIFGIASILLNDEEKRQIKRWQGSRQELEEAIRNHRRRISNHLAEARSESNFLMLRQIYYESIQLADGAYEMKTNANTSVSCTFKSIDAVRNEMNSIWSKLNDKSVSLKVTERKSLYETLGKLKSAKESLYHEKDTLVSQRNEFLAEVKELNKKTAELRTVMAQCGRGGKMWLKKLNERKSLRGVRTGKKEVRKSRGLWDF